MKYTIIILSIVMLVLAHDIRSTDLVSTSAEQHRHSPTCDCCNKMVTIGVKHSPNCSCCKSYNPVDPRIDTDEPVMAIVDPRIDSKSHAN